MTKSVTITAEQHKEILNLLELHLPNTTVWAYGSRVKSSARQDSDLDLVAFASKEQELQLFNLREAFAESYLPFRIDLLVWDKVPEKFQKNIEVNHIVLFEKKS